MQFQFVCPRCDQRLKASRERIGSRLACPKCREPLVVPAVEIAAAQMAARQAERARASETAFSEFAVFDNDDEDDAAIDLFADFSLPPPPASGANGGGHYDPTYLAVPRYTLYAQGALLVFVALIAFWLGSLMGSPRGGGNDEANAAPCVVSGRVLLADANGAERPDDGSVVIIVPERNRPDEKIAVEVLRPDAPILAHRPPAILAIEALGGVYTRTDTQGRFQARLSRPGHYFVLVLSKNRRRPAGALPESDHMAQMGRYFLPAMDLVSDFEYRWEAHRIFGDTSLEIVFKPR